ncbi:MAG: hypothetical protein FJ213_01060 [Ignavibacteria bacterium]|nr:hypothetical protein [Ignavibacteria bacterium]
MKTIISLIAVLGIFSVNSVSAADLSKLVETNLKNSLQTENSMIKSDAINLAGDLKMDEVVIQLMKILKSDKNKELRILAAIALHKIQDDRGLFAIKQAIHFDDERCVRRACAYLSVTDVT